MIFQDALVESGGRISTRSKHLSLPAVLLNGLLDFPETLSAAWGQAGARQLLQDSRKRWLSRQE